MRIPTAVVVVSVWMALPGEGTQRDARPVTDSIRSSTSRFAVESAVRGAAHQLERPECAAVLSDFSDARGRTIGERLALLGETPQSYLTRIVFREAVDHWCQHPTRLAFTFVGAPEVFICGPQFWRKYQEDPRYLEALMIHEMMHTLGLGENPPTSIEISARVLKRCWSTDCHRPVHK